MMAGHLKQKQSDFFLSMSFGFHSPVRLTFQMDKGNETWPIIIAVSSLSTFITANVFQVANVQEKPT